MRRDGSQGTLALIGSAALIAVVLVLFGRVQPTVAAACDAPTKTFDGGAGTNLWNAAANWSPDGVPVATDDVCIAGASVSILNTNGAARTFEVVSGASLSIAAVSSLAVAGPAGSSVDSGATLSVAGTISGGASSTSPLTIHGTLDLSGTGHVALPLTNTGAITRSSGTGTALISNTFTNNGSLTVATGTLRLNGSGTSSGQVVIASGAVLSQTGGTFTYDPTATISGAGQLHVAGATVVLSAGTTYGLDAFIVSGGTLTLNESYVIPSVSLSAGTINGPGNLTVTSALTITGNPAMTGGASATTTVASTADATFSVPTGALTLGRTLSIASGATLTFDGNGTIASGGVGNVGSIVNAGSMIVTGNTSQVSVALTNTGAITRQTGTGIAIFSNTFTNSGSLTVATGTLRLNGSGTSSGQVVIASGAILSQTGGTFTYDPTATISGAGQLHVAGATVVLSAGTTYGLDAFIVSGGTLTLNESYVIPSVSLSAGTINGPGNLTVTSALTITGNPAMTGGASATTTVASTANATFSVPTGALTLGRTLSIASGATLTFDGNGTIASGGVGNVGSIVNAGSMIVTGNTSQVSVALTNTGAITRQTGTGIAIFSNTFTNSGSLTVATGTLRLNGSGTSSGQVVIASGAILTQTGGTFTYDPTATISGAGQLHVAGATVVLSAGTTYGLDAFIVSGGTLTLNESYVIPSVSLSAGTINGPGNLTVTSALTITGNPAMTGGASATTTVASTANATFSIPTGALTLGRTLSIASGATLTFDGNGTIASGGVGNVGSIVNAGSMIVTGNTSQVSVALTNTGAITRQTGTGIAIFSNTFTNSGTLTVATGTLNLAGQFLNYNQATDILTGGAYHVVGTLRFVGADIVTNNGALIELNGPASLILDSSSNDGFRNFTTNAGTLAIVGGRTLTLPKALTNTGVLIVGAASTLATPSVDNSGTMSGSGTVAAPVTSSGDVLPGSSPGILTITGSYSQVSAGSLEIEIGGADPGTGHDQLSISGAATLDGELVLSTTGGFTPSIGQTFTILTYASHAGCFSSVLGRDLGDLGQGLFFNVACGPTSAVVTTMRAEFSIDDVTIDEDDADGKATFTLSRNVSRPDLPTSVDWAALDGTAIADDDYAARTGTVLFPAGVTALSVTIDIAITDDALDEFDEAFTIQLSNAANAFVADPSGTGTIVDDDPPPLVSIADLSVAEGDGEPIVVTFTVSLSAPSGKPITVDFAVADGSATAGEDYTAEPDTLGFVPGDTTAQATVQVLGDLVDEFDESFSVSLANPMNAVLDDYQATGTILDNDPPPTVSISDSTVTEGDSGSVDATFTVSLSGPSAKPISVDYATSDGTATAGLDYTTSAGSLDFDPGDTTALLTVVVAGDITDEFLESYTVGLTNATNADIDDATGSGTIDDDDPPPTVSIADVSVVEGNSGSVDAVFKVSLSAPSGKSISIPYSTLDGTATAGDDYDSASDVLIFAPGETEMDIAIKVLGDVLDESDETFTVVFGDPGSVVIEDGTATGTIVDDDSPPLLSISDVTVTEGNDGTTPATFTVSLSAPSTNPVSVEFSTADDTAAAGLDYVSESGTVSFPPGATTGQFSIDVSGDILDESNEQFSVTLVNATNATIDDGTGIGVIQDDDPLTSLSIDDVSVAEGDAGTTPATFTVSLSAPSGKTVTVDFATAGESAQAGVDYIALAGTLTFAPGDTSEQITVQVSGDALDEPDETFTIELSNASGAVIADGSATVTIVDDDDALSADVSITKTADHNTSDNPVPPGGYLAYTLTVANAGPGTAADIQVSDVLPRPSTPDDAEWCEVIAPATTCDPKAGEPYDSGTAIPAIEKLAEGESRRFRIGYTVAAGAPSGLMQNTASITSGSTDPNATNDSSMVTVLVDVPPTASFTFTPATPIAGDIVRFDASGSTDDDGIVDFAWEFGDGATGTGSTTTHIYTAANTYVAVLTVTDSVGGMSTTMRTVVVSPPPPSAGRVLRGTVTRLVAFGPGGDPAGGRVPYAGAEVTVGTGRGTVQTTTDAQGGYAFTNLTACSTCPVVVSAPGSAANLAQASVVLGPNPSLTVRDFVTGTGRDPLYVTGLILPPTVHEGDPQPPAPVTVGIRVYRGSSTLLVDSATTFGGPGGRGAYQLFIGRAGGSPLQVGTQLRVVLVENGVEGAQTTVQVPPLIGSPLVTTAADLVGQNPPPSAGRVLRGTVTRLVAFGPGGDPAGGRVPYAGAEVTVGTGRGTVQTTTDAQGGYAFTNLTACSTCPVVVSAPGSAANLAQASVVLGPNPSLTVRDFVTGTGRDPLYVTGLILPPTVHEGDPQPPAPVTVGIRVYRGSSTLLVDSATTFGGPGGRGAYQLFIGRAGGSPLQVGTQLRVVLVENGVEGAQTTVQVPPLIGSPLVTTAADLVGQ